MTEPPRHLHFKRWSAAWLAAIVLHALLVGIIAWRLLPDRDVHVSGMVPAPGETVSLLPAQAIEPAVFFTSKPDNLNPEAAFLYRVQADGTRELVSGARAHPKRDFGFQFDAVFEPGNYEIVVLDGSRGVVSDPNYFDGEFEGAFPSGNGKPGGAFSAQFKIEYKAHEVMTASLYEPDKPMKNEEPAAKSVQQEPRKPEKPVQQPKTPPQEPKAPRKPRPQKPSDAPKTPAVAENLAPIESSPDVENTEPSHIAISPENLRISPFNFAPELMNESAQIAAQNFAERDTNKFVAAADLAKKRYEAAYNADGPVIGPGQQGNSLSHQKDVAEYLALMHKEIHPLWAHGYLLRLDTIYRQPGSAINNPDLEAVLEITLDGLGAVSDVRMVRSSGITDYDNEAIHVAWNSSPGTPPPKEMQSPNGRSYIHWTFWRDQRQCGVFGVKVFRLTGSKRDALNFSLKAVQAQEKKLGLQPSVIQLPGDGNAKPSQSPEPSEPPVIPPSERINPLED